MAQIIWTEPALAELDAIADYIALDKPSAAERLVKLVFSSIERLSKFPDSGSHLPEMPGSIYRQVVVPPCRIFYRHDGTTVFILFVMRGERQFRKEFLEE
ncbi:MAG TPA: type II toxin-antitoxin system RelE/ParE family toxin [Chthoniobacteraceae bacterium]|nr:type II toxin-antitoxin system RelE/ParE family toxin [Chthoniobacteraceae bacterium]